MFEFQAVVFGIAMILIMVAGTMRSVISNLRMRPSARSRPGAIAVLGLGIWLLWIMVGILVVVAVPHPMTVIAVVVLLLAVFFHGRMNLRDEAQSLDRWIGFVGSGGGPVGEMAEGFAGGCQTRVGERAKRLSLNLSRGLPPGDAINQSRLPLSADSIAVMTLPRSGGRQKSVRQWHRTHQRSESDRAHARFWERFAYAYLLVLLAWFLGTFVPWLGGWPMDELAQEFDVNLNRDGGWRTCLVWSRAASHFLLAGMTIWACAAILIPILPEWIASRVPWFGRAWQNRERADSFLALARGVRAELPESELLDGNVRHSRSRWIRNRSRKVRRFQANGMSLIDSMKQSRWVDQREHAWLTLAASNGNLPQSMEQLSDDIRRHEMITWHYRMAWFVPTITILVAVYVLLHFWEVISFLVKLIQIGT